MKKGMGLAIIWLILNLPAFSQWPTSPEERLALGIGTAAKIVSDASGGAFVVYSANTGTMESRCYFQKTNLYGYPLLPSPLHLNSGNGVYVEDFEAVTDGAGGVIIAVLERCSQEPAWYWKISLYRFNSLGETIYWNVSANASQEVVPQGYFVMAADSSEGCYLSYMDIADFRIQHVNPAGLLLWGDEGLSLDVGSAYPEPYDLTIGADAAHCYLTVRGTNLYAFKFTPEGTPVWGETGVVIADLGQETQLAPDGTGGFVEICREQNQSRLLAYRLDEIGNWVWSQAGVELGNVYWDKQVLCHYPYAYVAWLTEDSPHQIKLQKLDYAGLLQWSESLTAFSGTANQDEPCLSEADNSGLVLLGKQEADIYAQKFSYDGEKLWDTNDVALTTRGYPAFSLGVNSNGTGGGVFTWYEIDPLSGQLVCAAMVNSEGGLGEVLGIEPWTEPNLPQGLRLRVFPNPTNAWFTINYQLTTRQPAALVIFNQLGQLLWQKDLGWQLPGSYQLTYRNEQLPSGNYILQLQTPERRCSQILTIIK